MVLQSLCCVLIFFIIHDIFNYEPHGCILNWHLIKADAVTIYTVKQQWKWSWNIYHLLFRPFLLKSTNELKINSKRFTQISIPFSLFVLNIYIIANCCANRRCMFRTINSICFSCCFCVLLKASLFAGLDTETVHTQLLHTGIMVNYGRSRHHNILGLVILVIWIARYTMVSDCRLLIYHNHIFCIEIIGDEIVECLASWIAGYMQLSVELINKVNGDFKFILYIEYNEEICTRFAFS